MDPHTCRQLACRNCRFFQPEGHYQGSCDRMNVTVKGDWQACHLISQAFGSFSRVSASEKREKLLC
jgi:hypothetical protein